MLLAIETATNVCSVAFQNNRREIFEKRSETHGSHSENLFLFIDEMMKKHSFSVNELDAILVSEGPGSYTGLRIAASGVKGLLFGSDVPLYGVNTLASFAIAAAKEQSGRVKIHSIIDAKRKHLYHQQFVYDEELKAKSDVQITLIKEIEESVKSGDTLIGTGFERIEQEVKAKAEIFNQKYITARSLISLYGAGGKEFVHEAKASAFEPKYYTSNR